MKKNKLFIALMLLTGLFFTSQTNAALEDYNTLRDIDKGTFNEYRYRIVNEYFKLRSNYQIYKDGGGPLIDKTSLTNISNFAKTGYNYLPDMLMNKNIYNNLQTAIQKGLNNPNSEVYYVDIEKEIQNYLEKVNIQTIKGSISVSPSTGNAPLNVTFRANNIVDPSKTIIPTTNYIWWVNNGGKKAIVGRGLSFNYTFYTEGTYSVNLDVKSNNKNAGGYTDVLPFSSSQQVQVKEKIASLLININSIRLGNTDEIKFTPEEGSYGIIFDATSSTPTGGAKFTQTEWDFGNGITRKYDGVPKVERVVYSQEGNYPVRFKLTTNEGNVVERKFNVLINKPIATIQVSNEDGYIGDKFTFSTRSSVNNRNLSYTWNIIDIDNDKIITQQNGSTFNYEFKDKGRFNVQLKIKDSAGNEDIDTKIIYINSRAPIANFSSSMPDASKPNRVLLNATISYDLDTNDIGKLKYVWKIDGNIVQLENPNNNGSYGYYTFDSVGEHEVLLEVTDPDQMSSNLKSNINIDSILSVNFAAFPRVIQRGNTIKFKATSPQAEYFEWNFGDSLDDIGKNAEITHKYEKSGMYTVVLTVRNKDQKTNTFSKVIYVADSNAPKAMIDLDLGNNEKALFKPGICAGNGAYVVDRVKSITFKGGESIDVNGLNTGLSYSWKIGNDKIVSSQDVVNKFDELGCFPVKLTVTSNETGKLDVDSTWVKVENVKPTLTGLNIAVVDYKTDPVVVNVSTVGQQDADGVIQSYLWYYYTDTDKEPQDFRITTQPSTSFVIPQITGNYNIVVVMKDNNEERVSSEELLSDKQSIQLYGDNVNTPLIDFSVNKNNVLIGDEIVFTNKVKNVLGNDITSKVDYSYDFDGDGFYDKETKEPSISYKYEKSGTFYAKVRAKYKGMTNVRTIEMNVANILKPDFDYVSIGNKFLFFNTSKGTYTQTQWDLGSGATNEQNYFSYDFESSQRPSSINLKISEGTKVENVSKDLKVNMKNFINSKKSNGLVIYTYPELQDNTITLDNETQKAYIYLGDSKGQITNYGVDFDIEADSDLNGTKDDDVDNKTDSSYTNGNILEIKLSNSKKQTLRAFITDVSGKTIESKDIVIDKTYIKEEETVNLSELTFTGVTDGEKEKIEKLKTFVEKLPQQNRLKAMKYIQTLQEEWFYASEKTKIILEFEGFIDTLDLPEEEEIINLLESFLVEGQEDQSVRNMSYNVVKNLIPKELVEYENILKNLDLIKSYPDKLEENKVFGKEILEMIKDTKLITNDDKLTIKTQLQVMIYGSVDNIPKEVKEEVKTETKQSSSGSLMNVLMIVIKIIGALFGLIVLVLGGFYVFFLNTNKNQNQGFQDFLIELFDDSKKEKRQVTQEVKKIIKEEPKEQKVKEDVLNNEQSTTTESKEDDKVPAWLSGGSSFSEETKKQEVLNPKVEEIKAEEPKIQEEKVPSWLAGAVASTTQEPKVEEVKEEKIEQKEEINNIPEEIETKVQEEKVPDWLMGGIANNSEEKTEEAKEPIEEPEQIETKVEEEKVPDWLMGGITNTSEEKIEEKEELNNLPEQIETKVQEEKVPDWLMGIQTQEEDKTDESLENKDTEVADDFDFEKVTREEEIITPVKKTTKAKKPETVVEENKKPQETKTTSKKTKKDENLEEEKDVTPKKTTKAKAKDESKASTDAQDLWDDGMDIPDWLKSSSQD